jgi:hypothetical protein
MNLLRPTIFAAAAASACAGVASANILVNGDFESQPNWSAANTGDPGFSLMTGTQMPGWVIEPGHAVTVHNTFQYPVISGSYSVNTDGEGYNGGNANFYQDFAAGLGDAGLLQFDWQGWQNWAPSSLLNISIVDTVTNSLLVSGSYSYNAALHHEMLNFVGTGNTLRLRVQEIPQSGSNDNQFMVDNFSVTIPAPAGGALLGIVGLVRSRRRR